VRGLRLYRSIPLGRTLTLTSPSEGEATPLPAEYIQLSSTLAIRLRTPPADTSFICLCPIDTLNCVN
jgi:hypothetical protein